MAEMRQIPDFDPRDLAAKLCAALTNLVRYAREDIGKVNEPMGRALLETTAEIGTGPATALRTTSRKRAGPAVSRASRKSPMSLPSGAPVH